MPTIVQRDYYAKRAKEVRELAKVAIDPDIRATLESMAQSYEHLVDEADLIARYRGELPKGASD